MQTVLARLKQKNKLSKKNSLPFLEVSLLCSGSLPLRETCHPQSGHSQYMERQGLWFFFSKIIMYSTACGLELGVRLNLIFFSPFINSVVVWSPSQMFTQTRSHFCSTICLAWVSGAVYITLQEFDNGGYTLKTRAGEIFNAEKLNGEKYMIIVAPWFTKSYLFKMFPVNKKTKNQRFQIPPVWRAFSKSSGCFRDG